MLKKIKKIKLCLINKILNKRCFSEAYRIKLAVDIESLYRRKAIRNQGNRTDIKKNQNFLRVNTNKELAKLAKVSPTRFSQMKWFLKNGKRYLSSELFEKKYEKLIQNDTTIYKIYVSVREIRNKQKI